MDNQAENGKRIVKNTLLLYGRMLLTMWISLYTARMVLKVLGIVDYGIYNVVGGIVALLWALNGALSSSTTRRSRQSKPFETSVWYFVDNPWHYFCVGSFD